MDGRESKEKSTPESRTARALFIALVLVCQVLHIPHTNVSHAIELHDARLTDLHLLMYFLTSSSRIREEPRKMQDDTVSGVEGAATAVVGATAATAGAAGTPSPATAVVGATAATATAAMTPSPAPPRCQSRPKEARARRRSSLLGRCRKEAEAGSASCETTTVQRV